MFILPKANLLKEINDIKNFFANANFFSSYECEREKSEEFEEAAGKSVMTSSSQSKKKFLFGEVDYII